MDDLYFDEPTDVCDLETILNNLVAQSLGYAYFIEKATLEYLTSRILRHQTIPLEEKRQFVLFAETAYSKVYSQHSAGATNKQLAKTAFIAVLLRRMTRLVQPNGWSLPTVQDVFRVDAKEEEFARGGMTLPPFKMPSKEDIRRIDLYAQVESREGQEVNVEPSGLFFSEMITELGTPPCPKPSNKAVQIAEVAKTFLNHINKFKDRKPDNQTTMEVPALTGCGIDKPDPRENAKAPKGWVPPPEARQRRKAGQDHLLSELIQELGRRKPRAPLRGVKARPCKASKAVTATVRKMNALRTAKRLSRRGIANAVVVLRQEKQNSEVGIPLNPRGLTYALRQCKASAAGVSYFGEKIMADFHQLISCRPSIQRLREAYHRLERLDKQLGSIRERGDAQILDIFMGSGLVQKWERLPTLWKEGTADIIDYVCDSACRAPATACKSGSAGRIERVNKYFGSLEEYFKVILQNVLVDTCSQEERVSRMWTLVQLIK